MIVLQALLCLALQDGARELVEKLRSDTIAERETAMRRLRELGKEAAPELEKAAKDPDAEVARRAGFLLRCLALQDSLSPALRKAVPGIEDLLAAGRTRAWTEAFLRAARIEDLPTGDLEVLAPQALRGADGVEEKQNVLLYITRRRIVSALPEVLKLLRDPDESIAIHAAEALPRIATAATRKEVTALLKDPDPAIRRRACGVLGDLTADEAAPAIAALFGDPDLAVRQQALTSIGFLDAGSLAPGILACLSDKSFNIRNAAAEALGRLGSREALPGLLDLLKHEDEDTRGLAVATLATLRAKETAPDIAKLLTDKDSG